MVGIKSAPSQRLARRKRVTLISSWRCNDASVICADSQEMVGGYRATVQKITPKEMGQFQVIVAGSGDGDLIDSFGIRLKRRMDREATTSLDEFVAIAENELAAFYENDVRLSPLPDDQKWFKLTIAASCPETQEH